MTQVTMHDDTPSQAIVKAANEMVYVTDSKNRILGLRRLNFLEEFRIVEALGSELSSNTTYMGMLNPLLYLAEIDGEPVGIPKSKMQAEALIQRAGREGFMAVIRGHHEALRPRRRGIPGAGKKRLRHPGLRDRLWLVKNSVPYNVAFTLPPEDVFAYGIIFGEFEGNEFDMKLFQWKKRE